MRNHLQNGEGWRLDISYSEAIDIALVKEKKKPVPLNRSAVLLEMWLV